MCGICGVISLRVDVDPTGRRGLVHRMNEALIHRGPDDDGYYHDVNGSIAMRRLAIIDTVGGIQPISDALDRRCIVFNGEIYNYRELRKDLLGHGYQFQTNSDTEVLIHLYDLFGKEMLSQLRGMFSFCIYDKTDGSFFLARDPFGEKPLYYTLTNSEISFSSEIPSLLQNQRIPRVLNQEALPYYLRTTLVPEPLTLFKDILALPAGHFMKGSQNNVSIESYFHPTYPEQPTLQNEKDALESITPLLHQAVKRQMVSDVPIGAFLSGGIDSSSMVALMQLQSDQRIDTFNVKFADQQYDESHVAKIVAQHCGTDHHEVFIPAMDFDESIFWTLIDHFGLPFRDSSAIPMFYVSREISKHVKVAISGDGGDEIFGGYQMYQWYQKIMKLKRSPVWMRRFGEQLTGWLNKKVAKGKVDRIRQAHRAIRTSLLQKSDIPISLNEFFSDQEILELWKGSALDLEFKHLKTYPDESRNWTDLRMIMYHRLINTLPSNMLMKVDRMSMANSLEVRAPLLDVDLFNASIQLADDLLINQQKSKYILRKAMRKYLPKAVFEHPKQGFNLPLHSFHNNSYASLAKSLLFEKNPWPELFDPEFLRNIFNRGMGLESNHVQSKFQDAHQLWMMMQLLGWANRYQVEIDE